MFHSTFDRQEYADYVANYSAALTLLDGLLVECLPPGALPSEIPGQLVWASIHGITELGIAARLEDGDRERLLLLVDAAVDTLLKGLQHVRM